MGTAIRRGKILIGDKEIDKEEFFALGMGIYKEGIEEIERLKKDYGDFGSFAWDGQDQDPDYDCSKAWRRQSADQENKLKRYWNKRKKRKKSLLFNAKHCLRTV